MRRRRRTPRRDFVARSGSRESHWPFAQLWLERGCRIIPGMELFYHESDRSVLVLSADGGLNADTAVELVAQLESLVNAGITKIIIDCTRLTYLSSYGIGVLVRLHGKLARRGGDVKVASVQSRVLQALNLARLGQIFQIYPDVNQARLAFRGTEK